VAAGAYPVKPWAVSGFEDADANGAPPEGAGQWRLDEQKDLLTLLRATVQSGSGHRAQLSIPAYGKTGTSQDYRDAWFIGFAGNLVVGVWVGNDDFTAMKGVTGGSLPAEIWATFMRDAIKQEGFPHDLPQIAAFPAKPRVDRPEVALASSALAPAEHPRPVTRRVHRVPQFGVFERAPQPRRPRRGLFGGLFR